MVRIYTLVNRFLIFLPGLFLFLQSQAQLHVQTDRVAYANMDTIWYAVQAPRHLADSSTTVFLELIDAYRQTVLTQKRPLYFGQAHGAIVLPDTLLRGAYRLRAYTETGERTSVLFWITTRNQKMALAPPLDSALIVQFFPEGGTFIQSLPSRLAVSTQSVDGQGVDTEITIADGQGQQILQTKTNSEGIGEFILVPQPGKRYTATISWRDTMRYVVALPVAKPEGIVLQVDGISNPNVVKIRILTTRLSQPPLLKLWGYANDSLIFDLADSSGRAVITTQIPKSVFPQGMLRFVVTDFNNSVLAERWITGKIEPIEPELSFDKPFYQPNEEMNITLHLQPEGGRLLKGIGSMVIVDSTQEMYFPQKPSLAHANETYLLTLPSYKTPERVSHSGLWVMAQVLNEREKPVSSANLLLLETRFKQSINLTTNAQGYFKIDGMTHEGDTLHWVIQRVSGKNHPEKTALKIIEPPHPTFTQEFFPSLMRDVRSSVANDTILSIKEGTTLAGVTVKAKRYIEREYYLADYTVNVTDKFLANAGVLSGKQLLNYLGQMDPRFMRMRSKGGNGRGPTGFPIKQLLVSQPTAAPTNFGVESEDMDPLNQPTGGVIIIDRQLFSDVQTRLSGLSAYDIERIEIVRSFTKPLIITTGGIPPNPAKDFMIAITTRMGPYGNKQYTLNQTVSKLSIVGYTPVPDFNSFSINVPAEKFPSYHPTIYWNSSIRFPATVRIRAGNKTGRYRMLVRGISDQGQYFEKMEWIEIK